MRVIFLMVLLAASTVAQAGKIDSLVYFQMPSNTDRNSAVAPGGDIAAAHSVGAQVSGNSGGTATAAGLTAGAIIYNMLKGEDPQKVKDWTIVGLDAKCEPTVIRVANRNKILSKDGRELMISEWRWAHLTQNDAEELVIEPLEVPAAVKSHPCWNSYLIKANATKSGQRHNPEEFYR